MSGYPITPDQAERILRESVDTLSEPLRSAVEFALTNWHKITGTTNAAIKAKEFLASLPMVPLTRNEASQEIIIKLNEAIVTLRRDQSIWLSVENLPHEIWRDICDYEGRYQISNFARVKSFFNGSVKILKSGDNGNGYMVVNLSKDAKHKMFTLHTLVARHFIPNPNNKPEVNHYYGKDNYCVWALEWATPSENGFHAYATGLKRAERPKAAKLSDEAVLYIRKVYIPYDPQFGAKTLAEVFGVDASTIRRAAYGDTYKTT